MFGELVAQCAVGAVFIWNMVCAVGFVLDPAASAVAYGLADPSSPATQALVAGLGVAFMMWNATYPAVIAAPRRFRALFAVVLAQQLVGLVGESIILGGLVAAGAGGLPVADGIERFVSFDAAGLALIALGFLLTLPPARHTQAVESSHVMAPVPLTDTHDENTGVQRDCTSNATGSTTSNGYHS